MKFKTSYWLIAMLAVLMTACSGKHELLETIPANARGVALVNLEDILAKAGFKVSGTNTEAPDYFKGVMTESMLKSLTTVNKAVAIDQIAVVMSSGGEAYFTAMVRDDNALADYAKTFNATAEKVGDYDGFVLQPVGAMLLTKDGHLWGKMMDYENSDIKSFATEIDNERQAAKKDAIAKLSGVKNFLEGDETITCALSPQLLGPNNMEAEEGGWSLFNIDIQDKAIVVNGGMQRGDGRVIETPGTQPINDAVLGYVPGTFNIVGAMGLSSKYPWDQITQYAGLAGGYKIQGAFSMVLPYLKAIDGTVLFGAGATGNESYLAPSLSNWQFLLMAHMPQATIDEALTNVKDLLTASGATFSDTKEGMISTTFEGTTLNIGSVDGYLTVANIPVSPNQKNDLAPIFEGKNGAFALEIPSLNTIYPTLPNWGVKIVTQATKTEGTGKITLVGTNENILPALLKLAK